MPNRVATSFAAVRFKSQTATSSVLDLNFKNAGICFFPAIKPEPIIAARILFNLPSQISVIVQHKFAQGSSHRRAARQPIQQTGLISPSVCDSTVLLFLSMNCSIQISSVNNCQICIDQSCAPLRCCCTRERTASG